ncbi:MAG: AraC family transcriptional regulator [bacterium]|jgi:two-component system response regulator YesN
MLVTERRPPRSTNGRLSIRHARDGGRRVLIVAGEVDLGTGAALVWGLRPAVAREGGVVVDLSLAEPRDEAGVTLLVNAVRRLPRDGRRVTVVCPPGTLRTALELAGVTRRVRVVGAGDTVADPPEEPAWAVVPRLATVRGQRASTRGTRAALLAEATVAIDERHADPNLSLDAVAREIAASRRQLQRVFAEITGSTFREELSAVRMQHAAALLRTTAVPVGLVARRVGYRQPPQFSKAFRRHHGVAPSAFRAAAR